MNISSICRTVSVLAPFWLVLGLPCQAQQPSPTARSQNEVQLLREAVVRLERENLELKAALDARQQEIAELRESQRDAMAALNSSQKTQKALTHEILAILQELHATVMRQEARVRGKGPLPKPPTEDPFGPKSKPLQQRKGPLPKPPAKDPFAGEASAGGAPKSSPSTISGPTSTSPRPEAAT